MRRLISIGLLSISTAIHAKGWAYSIGHGLARQMAEKDAVGLDRLVTCYIRIYHDEFQKR